jgi:hypothetical protein
MAKLGIHRDFLQDLVRLERPVQQKVVEAVLKFEQSTHAGLHLEKINHTRDRRLKSIRIDKFWRGVVLAPDIGDQHMLWKVLPHDDAYAWAQRRQVSVNMATGHMEIRDIEAIDATTAELATTDAPTPRLLFSHVSDTDLVRLGIDEQMRTFARLLSDLAPLEALAGHLPQTQYDVLIGLAAGMSPEEVWDDVIGAVTAEPYDPDDVTAAVLRTPDKVALVDGPDELMELFRSPFAQWRIYLHPTQRQVAYGNFSGSAQITGGPGTGKTVVALHRARHLAAQGGRVLFTTFSSTLTRSLADNLRLLETDDEILARIDIRTVDQLARRIVEDQIGRFSIVNDSEERDRWRRIIRKRGLQFNETFISAEWRQVVLAQNLRTLDDYLTARRIGRGKRLGPLQRTQVWRVISEFEQELSSQNARTFETVCVAAAIALSGQQDKPYDHVIVDEAQDLHPVRWRLLRAAVPVGANDLCIAGDTNQRIYDNRVSLRSVGIQVTGRSTQLTVNYRTTAEILAWSHAMLAGEPTDDLDGGAASLTGCRSEVHGHLPEMLGVNTRTEEMKRLTAKVRTWLDAGVEPGEIGISARSGPLAQEAVAALTKAGVAACHLTRDHDAIDEHVQAMTMHRMKGLEFRCVAVIGVNEHQLPAAGAVRSPADDELTHKNDLQRERCLLFVACTRAREELYISWHGNSSPFLV